MTTLDRINAEGQAHSYLGKNFRGEILIDQKAHDSFIEGAKSERNKTIDEAVVLLVKRGISEADYNGKIVLDTLRSLKVNP